MNNTWRHMLPVLAALAFPVFTSARAGEDAYRSVNVVKVTLPPLSRPEQSIRIAHIDPAPAAAGEPGEVKETKKPVAAAAPLEVITDIPGCVTPDVVAIDARHNASGATAYRTEHDSLRDLPGTDAFPVINLPVASAGVDPALPTMPVYRDAAVETLEPFIPAAARGAPRPAALRAPLPLGSARMAALSQIQPISLTGSWPPAPTPLDGAMPLTASVPAPGFSGGGDGGILGDARKQW